MDDMAQCGVALGITRSDGDGKYRVAKPCGGKGAGEAVELCGSLSSLTLCKSGTYNGQQA